MVVFVIGLPGSGKSYFAKELSQKISAVHLSSDVLRRNLINSPRYTEEEKQLVYHHLLEQLERIVRMGKTTIVDATFYKNHLRQKFMEMLTGRGIKYEIIEISASDADVKKRLSKARKDSDADYDVYLAIKKSWEPVKEDKLSLNSSKLALDKMIDKAVKYIG